LVGPLLGAFVVLFAQLGLSTYLDRWELVLGALFIVFVLFLPRGLMGLVRRA
jgi:branched-chain amino acid transport system permease protein